MKKYTPIALAQKRLSKIGVKLEYLRREGSDGFRVRVYGYTSLSDGRDEVFAAWIARDEVAFSPGEFTSTPGNQQRITEFLSEHIIGSNPDRVRAADVASVAGNQLNPAAVLQSSSRIARFHAGNPP